MIYNNTVKQRELKGCLGFTLFLSFMKLSFLSSRPIRPAGEIYNAKSTRSCKTREPEQR